MFAGAFALVNLVAYPLGRALGEPLFHYNWIAQDKVAQMDRLAESGRCIEVLVQGNSLAAGGVDPARLEERLGGRAYNGALWGTQLRHDVEWVDRFVLPRLDPRVVVLVVSPLSVSDTSAIAEEVDDEWARAPALRRGVLADVDRLVTKYVPVARYRDVLADPSKWRALLGGEPDEEDRRDPLLASMTDLGYIPVDRELDPDSQKAEDLENFARKLWVGDWRLSTRELRALADLAQIVRARGSSVVVALAPTSEAYRDMLPGGRAAYEKYRAEVVQVSSRVADEVVDLSDLEIPTAWFYDHIHLNRKAAEAFTDALAPTVRSVSTRCDRA